MVTDMNKKASLYILLDLVFLAVFNTVFFVIGGANHPASVWLAYGFIHFSYVMVLLTPFITAKCSSQSVFGFSLYSISSVYFFVEFVVGLFFVLVRSDSYKASLVVQVIIMGIYAVMLLSVLIANENTADSIKRHEAEVAYIKTAASAVKGLLGKVSDKKASKEIESVYDLLHSSPTRSGIDVATLEESITNSIFKLKDAVASDDAEAVISSSKEIIEFTEERNRRIKNSN